MSIIVAPESLTHSRIFFLRKVGILIFKQNFLDCLISLLKTFLEMSNKYLLYFYLLSMIRVLTVGSSISGYTI